MITLHKPLNNPRVSFLKVMKSGGLNRTIQQCLPVSLYNNCSFTSPLGFGMNKSDGYLPPEPALDPSGCFEPCKTCCLFSECISEFKWRQEELLLSTWIYTMLCPEILANIIFLCKLLSLLILKILLNNI